MLPICLAFLAAASSPSQKADSIAARHIQIARDAKVHCPVIAGCPEGVGLWVSLEPKSLPSQCTVFLVAPDLILTNHHCLPQPLRRPGAPCTGQAWVHFPSQPKLATDSVSCQEVVSLSNTSDSIDQPDWALVRLARPLTRQILPLSRDGVRDQDSLEAWACSPNWAQLMVRERIFAELRPLGCRASRRTAVFHDIGSAAEFSDSLSRRVPLTSCPGQKGNSGAPILRLGPDSVWRVHAILDRMASTSSLRNWAGSQKVTLLDSTFGDFAYATNLACIPLPGSGPLPASCQRDSNPSAHAMEQAWKREVDQAIAGLLHPAIPASLRFAPKVLQKGVWPSFSKAVVRSGANPDALIIPLPGCSSPGASDSLLQVPVWSMRFGYDRDLRWSYRFDLDRPQLAVYQRCRSLGRGKPDVCRFDGRFPGIGALTLASDTLRRCDDRTANH